MSAVFITGTDTGVGKTIVAGLLARFLAGKEVKVITQKWIQTGSKNFSLDVNAHLKLMNKRKKEIKDYLPFISSYNFDLSASPHLAARFEKKNIQPDKIRKSFEFLAERFDFIIVEGAGGALVPINKQKLLIDIACGLNLPAVIIASNKLGAINHTLLTIEALRARRMRIIGIIFNSTQRAVNKNVAEDNPRIVGRLSKENILGSLPWEKNKELLYKKFTPIAKKIHNFFKENG